MQQTAAATRPQGAPAQGCYKCGQKGHWSRDCTVPQSQWIPRQPGAGLAGGAGRAAGTPSQAPGNPDVGENEPLNLDQGEAQQAEQTVAALRKQKRKRPKLTVELLQSSKGLPDVMTNFPDAFRRQFKGRGHEASDLRRLLEMYKRWQDRVFPHGEFDAFICSLERLSGTAALKRHMHETHIRLLREVQDVADPPQLQLDDERDAADAAAGDPAPGAAAAAVHAEGDDELDLLVEMEEEDDLPELDDELLGMLEEPVGQPGGAGGASAAAGTAPAGAAAAPPQPDEDMEDILVEVEEEEEEQLYAAAQEAAQGGAAQALAQAAAPGEGDDELLLEEVEEEEEEPLQQAQQQQQQQQGDGGHYGGAAGATGAAAGAASAQTGPGTEEQEDEERMLLALAAEDGDDGPPSQFHRPAATGSLAATQGGAEPSELAARQMEPSLLLGAGTQEQGEGAAGGLPGGSGADAAAAGEEAGANGQRQQQCAPSQPPSPVLGASSAEDDASLAACLEPSPLLGDCTEEQLEGGSGAPFVPETELQVGSATQEL